MKKVSMLILLAIVLSTVLMAAVPTKMVRLTIINKSDPLIDTGDYAVYMKLPGASGPDAFYYLTVPAGSRDEPTFKIFTVMSDVYDRETWQCNGVRSAGSLIVAGNLRLTFTQCGQVSTYCDIFAADGTFLGKDTCNWYRWATSEGILAADTFAVTNRNWRVAGEPGMEKITYFKSLRSTLVSRFPRNATFTVSDIAGFNGWWTTGCATVWWLSSTWRTPLGCEWFYQY